MHTSHAMAVPCVSSMTPDTEARWLHKATELGTPRVPWGSQLALLQWLQQRLEAAW